MTTQEIADRLVELNRANDHKTAYQELFTNDAKSIENWGEREVHEGMEAIAKKGEQWEAAVEEVHEMSCSEPLVAEKSFAVTFSMDVTYKDGLGFPPGRSKMTELAVYSVNAEGKIYQEEFQG